MLQDKIYISLVTFFMLLSMILQKTKNMKISKNWIHTGFIAKSTIIRAVFPIEPWQKAKICGLQSPTVGGGLNRGVLPCMRGRAIGLW
jgi:hypothetical protein